jgi:uncharacterized protein YjbI with pentapeptide repeats
MKIEICNEYWMGHPPFRHKVNGKKFINVMFDNLIIKYARVINCSFERCEFKNCYIGFDVKYQNCTWNKCNFHGQYSAFGTPSYFTNCRFENITMRSISMDGCTFINCVISGKLRNMIWRGKYSPALGKLAFINCDLSDALFNNINIYAGIDFSNTILPTTGIRVFANSDGTFSKALHEAGEDLDGDDKITLQVLGLKECYSKQDPVIFDIETLQLIKTDISRNAFEKVAKDFEITWPGT